MLNRRQVIVISVLAILLLLPFAVVARKSNKATTRKPSHRVTHGRTSPPRTSNRKPTTHKPIHLKPSPSRYLPITTLPSNFYRTKSTRRTTVYHTTTPRYIYKTTTKTSHGSGSGWQDHSKKNQSILNVPKPPTTPKHYKTTTIVWQVPPPKKNSLTGSGTTRKPNVTGGGWQIPPSHGNNFDWTTPGSNQKLGWQIPSSKPAVNPTSPPDQKNEWTQKKNVSNIGWQIPSNKITPTSPPNNNFGWITPKANVSNMGWQIPSSKPTVNPTLPTNQKNDWWQKKNVSNIGWQIPTTNYSKSFNPTTPKTNLGWITPKTNVSNIGWQIPSSKSSVHPTVPSNQKNDWNLNKNSSNTGWQIPSYNNSKKFPPTTPLPNKNNHWTQSSIQTTLPPKIINKWTTNMNSTNTGNGPNNNWKLPKRNSSTPGLSPTSPNQNSVWLKPKNVTNLGSQIPSHGDFNNQNVGWTTSVPNFHAGITPRPPVIPSFIPGQTNNGVIHGPQQQNSYYTTQNQHYWNQGYQTPTYSPIINNYHTTNYGYIPPPVTIVNNNVNNHIHYPRYSYSTNDYGNDHLGFYLGYRLGKISSPSYHYYSSTYYNGHEHVPIYDHYEIHHYYHRNENVNKEAKIPATQVIACPGDSYAFCPPNTTALCLNGGSVMCVVKTDSTRPCPTDSSLKCLTSSIPCAESSNSDCGQSNSKYVSTSIPCMSTITVNGSLVNNNNYIIFTNSSQETNNLCVTIAALPAESKKNKKKYEEYRNRKTYHYKTLDMGTSSLGFLLGQTFEELLDPGFKYLNYHQNGSYIEKFDHYYVYNYYNDIDTLPRSFNLFPNITSGCLGDTATICPNETVALCTSDGSVLCLVGSKDAKPCNITNNGCIEERISCNYSKVPECRNNSNVNVLIPCFASVMLHGNVSIVNTTFVFNNITKNYSTLHVLPNVTRVNSYKLAVLAVPAEKTSLTSVSKEIDKIHNSNETYYNLQSYDYNKGRFKESSIDYFLLDKLDKLNFPSFYYLNIEITNKLREIQKYDHYDIQYNTPNSNYLPKDFDIHPNEILPCAGDSGIICPPNTTALCLTSGMVTCVTDAMLTVPCKNVTTQGKLCVNVKLPCKKKCLNKRINWNVSLPCMSFTTVHGNVIYVNNTITVHKRYGVKSKYNYADLEALDFENTTKKQIFCVTVVAVPGERILRESEKWLRNFQNLLSRVIVSKITL